MIMYSEFSLFIVNLLMVTLFTYLLVYLHPIAYLFILLCLLIMHLLSFLALYFENVSSKISVISKKSNMKVSC